MKTIYRFLGRVMLIVAFFILISRVSVLGNVSAAPDDSFSIIADNSSNSSAWDLKYSASENGFRITMTEHNGEKEFMVRSKFFEVAYVLNKHGFGARMIRPGKAQVPIQILDQTMNMTALRQQKVISVELISNEAAINLIASYLPDLINNNYKQLLR